MSKCYFGADGSLLWFQRRGIPWREKHRPSIDHFTVCAPGVINVSILYGRDNTYSFFYWLFRRLAASIWPACRYALNAHPSIDKDLDRSPWHCSLERDTHPWIAVHRIAAHPSITVGESTPSDWLGSPCTGDRFRERHALRSPCVETRPLIAVHRIVRRADTNFDCR